MLRFAAVLAIRFVWEDAMHAIVTGGSSGIDFALVRRLADRVSVRAVDDGDLAAEAPSAYVRIAAVDVAVAGVYPPAMSARDARRGERAHAPGDLRGLGQREDTDHGSGR